jgi:hypothetical protein
MSRRRSRRLKEPFARCGCPKTYWGVDHGPNCGNLGSSFPVPSPEEIAIHDAARQVAAREGLTEEESRRWLEREACAQGCSLVDLARQQFPDK